MRNLKNTPFYSITISNIIDFNTDFNNMYSLFVVFQGHAVVHINQVRFLLEENNIVLFEPEQQIRIESDNNTLFLHIQFKKSIFAQSLPTRLGYFQCNSVLYPSANYMPLIQLCTHTVNVYMQTDHTFSQLNFLAYGLISNLIGKYYFTDENTQMNKDEIRKKMILDYLEKNSQESLSLDDLANYLYLSVPYASRVFSTLFGKSFTEYLSDLRLEHVYDDLLLTDDSIITIAIQNGFSNISYFNKQFKQKYNLTPRELRKQHECERLCASSAESPSTTLKPLSLSILHSQTLSNFEISDILSKEKIFTIDINASFTPALKTFDFQHSIINIATASLSSLHDLDEKLQLVQSEIGFTYGRLELAMSTELLPTNPNGTDFNFIILNQLLMVIMSHDLIPYIDLSYEYADFCNEQDFKIDENKYLYDISSILHNLINTFGISSVKKWVFEIGYGMNLYSTYWESPHSFSLRFENAYSLIKRIIPDSKVGFFTHEHTIPEQRLEQIFQKLSGDACIPDFAGIALVSTITGTAASTFPECIEFSQEPDYPLKVVQKIKTMIRTVFTKKVPLHVDGICPSFTSCLYLNDTCYQSSYFLHNIIQLFGKAELLGIYQLSDSIYTNEAPMKTLFATSLLNGHPGLLNHSNIRKTGFHCLSNLARMKGKIIAEDTSYLVTFDSPHTYKIAIGNYVHVSQFFCENYHTDIERKNAYTVYNSGSMHRYQFNIQNIENGTYKYSIVRISKKYGNLFDMWMNNHFYNFFPPEDIAYYFQMCQPDIHFQEVNITDSKAVLNFEVEPMEVAFISFEKLI